MGLFRHEQRRLYQFIVTLLGNTVDADDVFQETSLAIWSAFDQFKPHTDFYCWARQIAYHRILRTIGTNTSVVSDISIPTCWSLSPLKRQFRIVSPKFQLPHCSSA